MRSNQVAPPREILDVCRVLNETIAEFVVTRETCRVEAYEADRHALGLTNLIIRQVEAVSELARSGVLLLPAAMLAARATFEAAIRLLWLLNPDDPFAREARWVAMIGEGMDNAQKMSRLILANGGDPTGAQEGAESLRDIRDTISQLLVARGYQPVERVPDVAAICKALGFAERYAAYRYMSQFMHSTWVALELYQRGFGTTWRPGEFVEASAWKTPLEVVWWSAVAAMRQALVRWHTTSEWFPTGALVDAGKTAFERLKSIERDAGVYRQNGTGAGVVRDRPVTGHPVSHEAIRCAWRTVEPDGRAADR